MKKTILFLTLLPLLLTAAPMKMGSTANGKTPGAIVVDEKAPPAVQFAAEELQKYLKLITGKHMPLRSEPRREPYSLKFFFALPDSQLPEKLKKKFAKDFAKLKDTDGYAVRSIGRAEIWFLADCPRGILNGVYRFLMKNTDIIWPRPAGELAVYSVNPDLAFTQTDYIDIPGFLQHGMGWNHIRAFKSQELALWNARVGSATCPSSVAENHGFARKIGAYDCFVDTYPTSGHCLVKFWLPPERFGKEHPEYYMLVDGQRFVKRNANLCVTNPAVAEALIARLKEELPKMTPRERLVSLAIADQGQCCECPECLKTIKLPDGRVIDKDHPAFRSTQFHIFFNKIARAFRKMAPDKELLQFGYMFLAEPPLVPVESNVRISFCPYIRNYKETVFGPTNEKWGIRTKKWLKLTGNLRWREYYGCGIMFPRPIADIAGQELKYLKKHHVKEVTSEITPSDDDHHPSSLPYPSSDAWDLTGVEIWTLFQLMWDPDRDPKALRSDYLKRAFREAAPAMEKFYALIHEAWHKDKAVSTFDDSLSKSFGYYIVDKKLTVPCRTALEEAEKLAVDPRSKRLVQQARATFERYVRDAASREVLTLKVPLLKTDSFPGFDLDKGVWAKAAEFPRMKRMGFPKEFSPVKARAKIFTDGKAFYIGTSEEKAAAEIFLKHPKAMPVDTFPAGDHIELFLTNNSTGRYHQFAYDFVGTRWDADTHNDKWTGDWEVRGEKTAKGWVAVAKMPYKMVQFTPWVKSSMKFLLFFASRAKTGRAMHATWGGGRVHSPGSFGTLEVEWDK